jgi:hypothetical protein
MKIKHVIFAILTAALSNQALGIGDDVNQQGFNLCKQEIQKQYRGKDRVLLQRTFYIDVSAEDKERTFYINGGHWNGDEWVHDRLTCLTSLNGRYLIKLDRADGRYARRSVEPGSPEIEVAVTQ